MCFHLQIWMQTPPGALLVFRGWGCNRSTFEILTSKSIFLNLKAIAFFKKVGLPGLLEPSEPPLPSLRSCVRQKNRNEKRLPCSLLPCFLYVSLHSCHIPKEIGELWSQLKHNGKSRLRWPNDVYRTTLLQVGFDDTLANQLAKANQVSAPHGSKEKRLESFPNSWME